MTETPASDAIAPGTLYVVATPIGNLGDLSPRAQQVLSSVSRICAEDTRTSGVLLRHFGISTPLLAVHDHNEDARCPSLVAALQQGQSLALISDAGTPLISDPGFALVRAAREANLPVVAIPGPSAVTAALSICGLPTDSFIFAGFLPHKASARRERLQDWQRETRSVVLYESSHRIEDCVADLVQVLGDERPLFLGRELSKRFEESLTAPAATVLSWLRSGEHRQRGEFVLVIGAAATTEAPDEAEGERVLRLLLQELTPSRAARLAAELTGAPRKRLYERALQLAPPAEDT